MAREMDVERDSNRVSANMRRIRRSGSTIERHLGSAMWRAGLRYRKQYPIEGRPDFAFPARHVAVFCDSHFWHGYGWPAARASMKRRLDFWVPKIERNIARDTEVNERLSTMGWTVLRFWEHEIKGDIERCVAEVKNALDENGP